MSKDRIHRLSSKFVFCYVQKYKDYTAQDDPTISSRSCITIGLEF